MKATEQYFPLVLFTVLPGGGGDYCHIKRGMLVVSLRGVNFGFSSH